MKEMRSANVILLVTVQWICNRKRSRWKGKTQSTNRFFLWSCLRYFSFLSERL